MTINYKATAACPCLCPACSCSYHVFSLCQLTTLTLHNSLSLSLPTQDLPLPRILPTTDSILVSELTPLTLWLDRFFWASQFWFLVSSLLCSGFFGSVQQIKLAICQLLDACKYSVSYHIVVKVFTVMIRRTVIIQPVHYSQLLLFNRLFFQSHWQVSQCLPRKPLGITGEGMRFFTNPFHHTLPVSMSQRWWLKPDFLAVVRESASF